MAAPPAKSTPIWLPSLHTANDVLKLLSQLKPLYRSIPVAELQKEVGLEPPRLKAWMAAEDDQSGEICIKHGNTRVATLREKYGEQFGREVRGNAKLETLLERTGSTSLSDYLKKNR